MFDKRWSNSAREVLLEGDIGVGSKALPPWVRGCLPRWINPIICAQPHNKYSNNYLVRRHEEYEQRLPWKEELPVVAFIRAASMSWKNLPINSFPPPNESNRQRLCHGGNQADAYSIVPSKWWCHGWHQEEFPDINFFLGNRRSTRRCDA